MEVRSCNVSDLLKDHRLLIDSDLAPKNPTGRVWTESSKYLEKQQRDGNRKHERQVKVVHS